MSKSNWIVSVVVLAAFWAAACGVPQAKYDEKIVKINALQNDLDKLRRAKESMQVANGELLKDLAKVKAALAKSNGELASLNEALAKSEQAKAELAKLKAKIAAEKALNAELQKQFRKMISAGQLRIINVNGRLVIKMASRILFKAGQANLTPGGWRAMRHLGKVLKKIPRHFQVAGHTDDRPIKKSKYKDNWDLSAARAAEVVRILVKVGVPGKNISAAAFSEFQPVSTNKFQRGRQLNRRIEITLLPVIPPRTK
ncbi:MAG: OmpA family protein [bacterium]